MKSKNLIGIPWRVAFALQADGWYLRQWCPWVKRSSMPESASDRPSTACETVFLLTKSPTYFFDMEAVKKQAKVNSEWPGSWGRAKEASPTDTRTGQFKGETDPDAGRNFRSADLWFDSVGMLIRDGEILGIDQPTTPYKDAHFATFAPKLVLPLILSGTSERGVCPGCGEPWVRVVERDRRATRPGTDTKVRKVATAPGRTPDGSTSWFRSEVGNRDPERHVTDTRTVGWEPGCSCNAGEPVPAVVCDPFAGSATTIAVAVERGRRAIGCELNQDYLRMARTRVGRVVPKLV